MDPSRKQLKRCQKKEYQTRMIFKKRYQLEDDDYDQEKCRTIVIDQRSPETHHLSIETILDDLLAPYLAKFQPVPKIEDCFSTPDKCFYMIRFAYPIDMSSSTINMEPKIEKLGLRFVSVPDSWMDQVLETFKSVIDQYHDELFHPINQPKGLTVVNDFIDPTEEVALIDFVQNSFLEAAKEQKVCSLKNRDAIHFGRAFDYGQNTIVETDDAVFRKNLPEIFKAIMDRFVANGHIDQLPDQLTINRYEGTRGDHIPLHCDTHTMCTETILSLSLGSDVVMTWKRSPDDHASTILPARSLMVMSGESRYAWKHGIMKTTADLIPLLWNNDHGKRRIVMRPRRERFSLTFRKTRQPGYQCQCDLCINNVPNVMDPHWDAPVLESQYVHETYDNIAEDFSSTRYKCWPEVTRFIQSLPRGSLVLDVGCGNGRFLTAASNPSVFIMGTDRSIGMLKICRQRNLETFLDNCLNVDRTIRPGIYDAVLSIAVIHHMSTEERRIRALHALFNLLAIGGCALIYVWAFEQNLSGGPTKYLNRNETESSVQPRKREETDGEFPKALTVHRNRTEFQQQDVMVPWIKTTSTKTESKKEFLRFYHVFTKGELERLIEQIAEQESRYRLQIERVYYDEGNWCAVVKKLSNIQTF